MRRAAIIGLLRRLLRDRRGVSAVEFALIAPVMLIIYFGLVEFSQGYMAERRASHAASMVADLVAQSGGTNIRDLESTFQIGDMIMRPFSSTPLSSASRASPWMRAAWPRSNGAAPTTAT